MRPVGSRILTPPLSVSHVSADSVAGPAGPTDGVALGAPSAPDPSPCFLRSPPAFLPPLLSWSLGLQVLPPHHHHHRPSLLVGSCFHPPAVAGPAGHPHWLQWGGHVARGAGPGGCQSAVLVQLPQGYQEGGASNPLPPSHAASDTQRKWGAGSPDLGEEQGCPPISCLGSVWSAGF